MTELPNTTKSHLANPVAGPGRWRSFARFALAGTVFYIAGPIAATLQGLITHGDLSQLLYHVFLLALLLVGFSLMGMVLDGQDEPFKAMGFVKRATAWQEWGLGAALGWGMVVLAVLPMAVTGAMRTILWTEPRAFWLFAINLGVLAVAALAEEVTFRGYPFQRLIEAAGPTTATVIMSVFFGVVHIWNTDASLISVLVTMLAGVLLSLAYLRTRALWLPWGLHLAWNLSMGAILGLPVSGFTDFSTIIQTQTVGAHWLTGGAYGPEAGLFTFLVLIAGTIVLVRVTRDYAWEYTHTPIVAAGYAVDVEPPKAHVEMEAKAAAAPQLVQIAASTSLDASLHSKELLPELPKGPLGQDAGE
ncbi:MAG TPA: type II CAAX endopeptidase family protein [Acidobacteriaceae bacterium]|nr:type II CAAX endopeptidase family protein [Acidobacteriaceae bacterium]